MPVTKVSFTRSGRPLASEEGAGRRGDGGAERKGELLRGRGKGEWATDRRRKETRVRA
jgi:hypothetical protein